MIHIAPATFANAKPDAALGGAPGSKEPAQTKTNNQHSKLNQAMPVRGTPQCSLCFLVAALPRAPRAARSPYLNLALRLPRLATKAS